MEDIDKTSWLIPWEALNEELRISVERELQKELAHGHVLFGRKLCGLAHRRDCDDVLFQLNGSNQLAVVHLSFPRPGPDRPPFPSTEIFESFDLFVAERMKPDNDDWNWNGKPANIG